jgi:hypothetical protein
LCSCGDEGNQTENKAENHESAETVRLKKFKTVIDSLLLAESPGDLEYYTQRWRGPTSLDTAQFPEPKADGYLGTFSYFPLPAFGDVYKVNLLGDLPEEYLVTFEMAPIMTNGGGFYMLVFGGDEVNNTFISDNSFQTENIDSLRFVRMIENKPQLDLLVYFDQEKSYYGNNGFKLLRMQENSLDCVLELRMEEVENSTFDALTGKYCSRQYSRSINFIDTDGDGHKEIHSTMTFDAFYPDETSEDSTIFEKHVRLAEHKEIWKWDSISRTYDAHVTEMLFYLPD